MAGYTYTRKEQAPVSMTVKIKFAPQSIYGATETVIHGVTEIHHNYPSPHKEARVAFESDIQGTGWTYDAADIAEYEATTESKEANARIAELEAQLAFAGVVLGTVASTKGWK